MVNTDKNVTASENDFITLLKILAGTSIGILFFFIPVTLGKVNTVLLDHASSFIIKDLRPFSLTIILVLMAYGGLSAFVDIQLRPFNLHLKKNLLAPKSLIFGSFKVLGFILAILYLTNTAPEWAMEQKTMLPFLFERLAMAVGILIPLGALALTFLIGYGFLEMIGVLMEKIMRPVFRTPGYSAVVAVTAFMGSYSIGILFINKMFVSGKYSARDAIISATGFSTVSATFMIIVARTSGLMEHWNFYFWSTFFITLIVTAITAYLPPLAGMDASYRENNEETFVGNRFREALRVGVLEYKNHPPLLKMLLDNLKDGLAMSAVVAPSILAIGFLGICVSKYTPVFEWLGYSLKPALFVAQSILGLENAMDTSGAFAAGLAEMFLPAVLLAHEGIAMRFIAAISCVTTILFFSGCIPCILATEIPVKIRDLVIIWFLRCSLSIIFAACAALIGLKMGWI